MLMFNLFLSIFYFIFILLFYYPAYKKIKDLEDRILDLELFNMEIVNNINKLKSKNISQ